MSASLFQILVVEDHESSRQLLSDMLTMLGHVVLCVASAEDAIAPLMSGKFNVLIADINLPGMSGFDLAKKAVGVVPNIKIVFASGYGYLVTDKTDFQFTLLPKPFDLGQLKLALDGH